MTKGPKQPLRYFGSFRHLQYRWRIQVSTQLQDLDDWRPSPLSFLPRVDYVDPDAVVLNRHEDAGRYRCLLMEDPVDFSTGDRFTTTELVKLEGTRVIAKAGGLTRAGTVGTIIAPRRLEGTWVLVVEWDDNHKEVFSKRDAETLLELKEARRR